MEVLSKFIFFAVFFPFFFRRTKAIKIKIFSRQYIIFIVKKKCGKMHIRISSRHLSCLYYDAIFLGAFIVLGGIILSRETRIDSFIQILYNLCTFLKIQYYIDITQEIKGKGENYESNRNIVQWAFTQWKNRLHFFFSVFANDFLEFILL